METRAREIKLLDSLLFQIYAIVVLKDKNHCAAGAQAIAATLDELNSIAHMSTSSNDANNICTLLFAVHDNGWCYTQMIRYLNDQDLIEKYLLLLDELRNKEACYRNIFTLLGAADLKGRLFVRGLGVGNIKAYLNLLFQLTLGDEENRIGLCDVQALLKKPSVDKTTFLDDIVIILTESKYKSLQTQYCELLFFMIDKGLIADKDFSYLDTCKNMMANYILYGCGEPIRKIMLEKAVNMDASLGQFFQNDANMLATFEIELNKIKPLTESKEDEKEVEEPENNFVNARPRLRSWFPFFSGKDKGGNEIPMQTFKVFSPGQSKSG